MVELRVPSIRCTLPFNIPAEDMDYAVLDLLGDGSKIRIISAADRAFDLQVIAVVLVESLERLDKQKVGRKLLCFSVRKQITWSKMRIMLTQIGPRQLEFPPNIPERESPGQ